MKTLNVKVYNLTSPNGNDVPNQYVITTADGRYFQSYNTVIAFKPFDSDIVYLDEKWNYSRTTSKYRNIFLNEDTSDCKANIKSGKYIVTNLNK